MRPTLRQLLGCALAIALLEAAFVIASLIAQ